MSKIILLVLLYLNTLINIGNSVTFKVMNSEIKLPPVDTKSSKPLVKDIQQRHSWRRFNKDSSLKIVQISGILWAAGGKTKDAITCATRTIPSAGARYPLEIFILVGEGKVSGLESGLYRYIVDGHAISRVYPEDVRADLAKACLNQEFISEAPISVIITAIYNRTTARYGTRGLRYVHMEVGHCCQNIYLMTEDLGLATVEIGAFNDELVRKVLKLNKDIEPLLVMPIGYPD